MFKERNFKIGDFIRLTSAGLEIAEFVNIRDVLISRYKEIYGSDIDLNTANADGVFVNDLALIINNILQTMKNLYANLDINTASGIYLDNLCRYANITRFPATASSASLVVTNNTSAEKTFGDLDGNGNTLNTLTFVDKSGTEWIGNAITLAAGASQEITVVCSIKGEVKAPAGWITQTMLVLGLGVNQAHDAILGTNVETDNELRLRRAQSSGANGTTVLESMTGALLAVSGIEDVKIYNNNTAEDKTALDGTTVTNRSIYVILRQHEGLTISNDTIGEIIYQKSTPGIFTCKTADTTTGVSGEYTFTPSNISFFGQKVYWKKAIGIAPKIMIDFTKTQYFEDNELDIMGEAILNYANNLLIGEQISKDLVFSSIYSADPMFKGQRTYNVLYSGITIENKTNTDTYYNYTKYAFNETKTQLIIS